MESEAFQDAKVQFAKATAQARKVEETRAALAAIFRAGVDGMVEPVSKTDLQRAAALMNPIQIDSVVQAPPQPALWESLALAPAFLVLFGYFPRFARGCDYLLRKHPAEPVVVPALATGNS